MRILVAEVFGLVAFSQLALGVAQGGLTLSPPQRGGLVFAKLHCSSCHAVAERSASPNPEAPTFQDIANRPGVTRATLRQFLRDSHNYPAAMNFRIDDGQITDLADYIGTLKKPHYRPDI